MRKKLRSIGMLLMLSALPILTALSWEHNATPVTSLTQDPNAYENNQVLALYRDGSIDVYTYDSRVALAQGLTALSEDPEISLLQPNYTYTSEAVSTNDSLSAKQWALSNDGSFEMEEKKNDFPVYQEPFKTPAPPGQWAPPAKGSHFRRYTEETPTDSAANTAAVPGIDVNAQAAWDLYGGGNRAVTVALIDTGVDYRHEDLTGVLWTNSGEIPDNGIDDDGDGYVDDVYGWNFYGGNNQIFTGDEDSHGTHGAGTIAANSGNGLGITGLIPGGQVTVMALKALGGRDGSGNTAALIEAIHYAEDHGASICNLSLGSSTDDKALYQTIADSNMLFVVAAGNEGTDNDTSPSYPASYALDNIISVANINYSGSLHDSSNYGLTSVDLAAPGTYILSSTAGNGYSYMTGTSMAAPMVTAAAAMVYSHFDTISLSQVREILLSSVKPLESLTGNVSTGGMLDIGAALSFEVTSLPDGSPNPAGP